MKKLLTIFVAAVELLAVLLPIVSAPSEGVVATVEVVGVCDLTLDKTSINFDAVQPNSTAGPKPVGVALTTNTDGTTLELSGADWLGFVQGNSMDVSATKYNTGGANVTLSTTPTGIFDSPVDADVSGTVNFMVSVPVGQAADTYIQDITFGFGC